MEARILEKAAVEVDDVARTVLVHDLTQKLETVAVDGMSVGLESLEAAEAVLAKGVN